MAEFVIKLADENGHVLEQVQTAASAEELRSRFTHAGYHVFSVRARAGLVQASRAAETAGEARAISLSPPSLLPSALSLSLSLFSPSPSERTPSTTKDKETRRTRY